MLFRSSVGQDATDAYVYQGELDLVGTVVLSGEVICMSAYVDLGAGITATADRVCALQAMISGSGAAATVTGDCFVAYIVNGGTVITTDSILCVKNQSASTATNLIEVDNTGTATNLLKLTDTLAGIVSTGGATMGANPKKIKVLVDGVTKYLVVADNWS